MRTLGIVTDQVIVEVLLHGLDAVIELLPPHDPEVLVEQRPVQALHEAVRLRTPLAGGAVFDLFELKEQFVGMPIRPATVFPSVFAEHGADPGAVFLEGRQHLVVQQVHGGQRQLVGIQMSPGMP